MQVCPDPNNPNPQLLGVEEISKKKVKSTMKELDGDPKLRTKGEIVLHLGKGTSIQGYARQKKMLYMDDGGKQYRYILLDVYRHGYLHHFAIPIALMATQPPLPTLTLSTDELKLLYTIAEALLDTASRTEKVIYIQRLEQVAVKLSRNQALQLSYKEELVANRLEQKPWVLSTMAQCLLCNIRPWLAEYDLPNYIAAFVVPTHSGQACQNTLLQLLRACNLTDNKVPMLNLNATKDLEEWVRYGCRMTLLKASSTIRKKIFQKNQLLTLYPGFSMMDKPYPGQVFLWTNAKYDDPNVFHIVLPQEPVPLSPEEQDAFCAFMGKILEKPKKLAERVATEYSSLTEEPTGYRTNPMEAWQRIAETIITEHLHKHCDAVKTAQKERQAQEEMWHSP